MPSGRNDPCPCGSGRKFKKCCALEAGELHRLGVLAVAAGRHDQAEPLLRQAVARQPDCAPYHVNLGVALSGLGRREEAAAECREALRLAPDFVEALSNLGCILRDLNRPGEALPYLERAAALAPESALAAEGCARALTELKRWSEAEPHFARWLALAPASATPHLAIADYYARQKLWPEAEAHSVQALELEPGSVEAANNLAACLGERGRSVEALAFLREAVRLNPGNASAWANLGCILRRLGQDETALRCFDFAVSVDPDHATAHWNRASLLLSLGRMSEGWAEYEWGWKSGARNPGRLCRQPRWEGSDPAGKTILVWMEQGLGDHIVFSSMLPDLAAAGARCIVECEPRLVTLFQRSFPAMEVVPQTQPPHPRTLAPDIDFQIPAGSLARWFRPNLESYPPHRGFLVPDPARVTRWKERVAVLGPGLKVGVCWRSKPAQGVRSQGNTDLGQWGPILTAPGVQFVNLQYDQCDEELRQAERLFGVRLQVWEDMDLKNDQEGVAALISALDLVLTATTAVVQMAGAVGAPAWVLSQLTDLSWWEMGSGRCPWHPSVRIFPCGLNAAWEPVLESMASGLRELAAQAVGDGR